MQNLDCFPSLHGKTGKIETVDMHRFIFFFLFLWDKFYSLRVYSMYNIIFVELTLYSLNSSLTTCFYDATNFCDVTMFLAHLKKIIGSMNSREIL